MISTTFLNPPEKIKNTWPRQKLFTDPVFRKALSWEVWPGVLQNLIAQGLEARAKQAINQVDKLPESYFNGYGSIIDQRRRVVLTEFKQLQEQQSSKLYATVLPGQKHVDTFSSPSVEPVELPQHTAQWQAVLNVVKAKTTLPRFSTWINPLACMLLTEDELVLQAPSQTHKNQLKSLELRPLIEEAVNTVYRINPVIRVEVKS